MTQIPHITLKELIDCLPPQVQTRSAKLIRRAYLFAEKAHAGVHRESGELYIEHDLAVAQIMALLVKDTTGIVASLLHDCLESHTTVREEDVLAEFGTDVVSLVTGLNGLYAYTEEKRGTADSGSYIPFVGEAVERPSLADYRADPARFQEKKQLYKKRQDKDREKRIFEEIRQAFLTITEGDIRVILIRMADCLQDLRKASNMSVAHQQDIATEAIKIYAPLANRLGIWQMKWELEDLAFRYLEPEVYKEIAGKLAERRAQRAERIDTAINKLKTKVETMGLKANITGRPKHIYSIYKKMERKGVDFDQIYDIQALRVILEPPNPESFEKKTQREKEEEERTLCYQVLGAVHSLWQPIPREFDDYIGAPKANGYKSLHTAVMDEDGHRLEVQIRTIGMHEEAEKGVAAHWTYKEDGIQLSTSAHKRIQSLRESLNILRDSNGSDENGDMVETEILADRIFVFTPKGDVVELPLGSTPIDFAYRVHTEIGHRCRSARVNNKIVSLDYKLKSGDRVEIITANRGGPNRDWMNASLGYTGSAQTRSKVRQWFRTQEREKNIQQGREVVERELKRLGLGDSHTVADIAKALKYDSVEQFLAKVGFGDIQSVQISGAIALMQTSLKPDDELRPLLLKDQPQTKGLTVLGLGGLHTKMAGCCNPIPPEPIVGFITRGRGVTIHRKDCQEVKALNEPERLIEVTWGQEAETYPIPIVVNAYHHPSLIDDVVNILRGQHIGFPKTKTTTANSMTTIYLIVEVTSLEQLHWLLQKFEKLPNVIEARRQKWT